MHRKRFKVREARDATHERSRSERRHRKRTDDLVKRSIGKALLHHLLGVRLSSRYVTVKKIKTEYGTFEFRIKQYYVQYIDENKLRRKMWYTADEQADMPLGRKVLRGITRTLRRMFYKYEAEFEKYKVLYELMRGRASVLLTVVYNVFPFAYFRHWIYDKHLLEFGPAEREVIIRKIIEYSRQKYIPQKEFMDPLMRGIFQRYIAMHMPYPCNFSMYALRITPVTFRVLRGTYVTLYVLRWTLAKNVKSDPYVGSSRRKSYEQIKWTYKPDVEIVNSRLYVGSYVLTDLSQKVPIDVNELYENIHSVPIRDIMFRPHLVKYYFAKSNGKPEEWYNFNHCSLYAIVERKVSRAKIDEVQLRRGLRRWYITSGRRRPWREYVSNVKYHS